MPAAAVAAFVLLLVDNCGPSVSNPSAPSGQTAATLEQQTHTRINEYRASKGLAALAWSDVIAAQARQHSESMAAGTTPFGHDGFSGRVAMIGQSLPWSSAGENVALNSSVNGAVEAWLNSPAHRENIEGDFNVTGVGASAGPSGSTYFTQIFVKSR